jgi:hypothetical protein
LFDNRLIKIGFHFFKANAIDGFETFEPFRPKPFKLFDTIASAAFQMLPAHINASPGLNHWFLSVSDSDAEKVGYVAKEY